MSHKDQKRSKAGKGEQASLTTFFASSTRPTQRDVKPATKDPNKSTDLGNKKRKAEDLSNDASSESLDPIVPEKVKWNEGRWKQNGEAVLYRRSGDTARRKVAAFDMDGTLLTWRTQGWPSSLSDYEVWNPSVIPKLRLLYDESNYQIVIITNQGGIRKAVTGKIATKVKSLTEWFIAKLERPVSVIMSTSKSSGYHKPSVDLWNLAFRLFGEDEMWDISDSFFVGDSVITDDDPQGGVDETLAKNVSEEYGTTLPFHTPTDFFGPSTSELRGRSKTLTIEDTPAEVLEERARLHSGTIEGKIMLMLCGAQGSGKSTFAKQLKGFRHICQDSINNGKAGTREQVEVAVREALGANQSVVLDRMHLDPSQREGFVSVAKQCGDTPVHTIVFDLPVSLMAKRVLERQNHIVSGESGARLAKQSAVRLMRPQLSEGILLRSTVQNPALLDRHLRLYNKTSDIPAEFPIRSATADEVLPMPSIILGTMGMGRRIALETISQAIELGIRGIDTAPSYKNEDLMPKSDLFCIVKVPKRASTPAEVVAELDGSLSKLQRSTADLLLLHWPAGENTKVLWGAMEALAKAGKANALGVCNFNVASLSHLLSFCTIRPSVLQIERHPRLAQWDLVDFCMQHDIQIQAHSPLGQGFVIEDDVVLDIAKRYNEASPAQIVLAWNLQQGVAVVPKCATKKHQQELLSIPSISTADLSLLNALSKRSPKRFVAAPFMYGNADYCWGKTFPKQKK